MSDLRTTTRLTPLPALIFSSRWLQLPLYLGLIVAQGVYVFLFAKELWHLILETPSLGEQEIMLIVLGLIDVVMISNLLVMVIVGGYETFVSRLGLQGHPDQPEWLSHVNASVLKVKLAMAIIGISSIHLLKTFIEVGGMGELPFCGTVEAFAGAQAAIVAKLHVKTCTTVTMLGVLWQTIIHTVFILSAIGIAWTDKLMTYTSSKREHVAAH
ncbi:MAG: TIGR00645 family protein [Lysobacter sp.]|nr:TIGR00645 family protein [Lysobacter sp.]